MPLVIDAREQEKHLSDNAAGYCVSLFPVRAVHTTVASRDALSHAALN